METNYTYKINIFIYLFINVYTIIKNNIIFSYLLNKSRIFVGYFLYGNKLYLYVY